MAHAPGPVTAAAIIFPSGNYRGFNSLRTHLPRTVRPMVRNPPPHRDNQDAGEICVLATHPRRALLGLLSQPNKTVRRQLPRPPWFFRQHRQLPSIAQRIHEASRGWIVRIPSGQSGQSLHPPGMRNRLLINYLQDLRRDSKRARFFADPDKLPAPPTPSRNPIARNSCLLEKTRSKAVEDALLFGTACSWTPVHAFPPEWWTGGRCAITSKRCIARRVPAMPSAQTSEPHVASVSERYIGTDPKVSPRFGR